MLDDVAFAQREKSVQSPAPALCHGPKVRELPLRLLCTIHQQLARRRVSPHLPRSLSPCTPPPPSRTSSCSAHGFWARRQDQQIFAWHDKFGTLPEFPNGTKRAAAEAAAMLIKQAAVDAAKQAAKQAAKKAAEQAEATQRTKDQAAEVASDKSVVAQQAAPAKAEEAMQV